MKALGGYPRKTVEGVLSPKSGIGSNRMFNNVESQNGPGSTRGSFGARGTGSGTGGDSTKRDNKPPSQQNNFRIQKSASVVNIGIKRVGQSPRAVNGKLSVKEETGQHGSGRMSGFIKGKK